MKNILLIFSLLLINIFVYYNCAEKPVHGSTFYNFEYDGENYRIRSVSVENNGYSYNELIGKEFIANDYDQDGYIDKITIGDIGITYAQKIYEQALSLLAGQKKLQEIKPTYHKYQSTNSEYSYEIKSFQPNNAEPFNQFKVVEKEMKTQPGFIMGVDQRANGRIDTVVVGSMSLEEIQTLYSNVLEKGLQNRELIKTGDMIIVK